MSRSIRTTVALVFALGACWEISTIAAPGGVALAQTKTPAPAPGANPTVQAPIGHRQPRPGDIPPDMEKAAKERDAKDAAEQRRLDRVLRNICRGC